MQTDSIIKYNYFRLCQTDNRFNVYKDTTYPDYNHSIFSVIFSNPSITDVRLGMDANTTAHFYGVFSFPLGFVHEHHITCGDLNRWVLACASHLGKEHKLAKANALKPC